MGAACFDAFKEIRDRHIKRLGESPEPGCGNAVRAAFIFLDLLKTDIDRFGEFLLRQADKSATLAKTLSDM